MCCTVGLSVLCRRRTSITRLRCWTLRPPSTAGQQRWRSATSCGMHGAQTRQKTASGGVHRRWSYNPHHPWGHRHLHPRWCAAPPGSQPTPLPRGTTSGTGSRFFGGTPETAKSNLNGWRLCPKWRPARRRLCAETVATLTTSPRVTCPPCLARQHPSVPQGPDRRARGRRASAVCPAAGPTAALRVVQRVGRQPRAFSGRCGKMFNGRRGSLCSWA